MRIEHVHMNEGTQAVIGAVVLDPAPIEDDSICLGFVTKGDPSG